MWYFVTYHDHSRPSEILFAKNLRWNEPKGYSHRSCGYRTREELIEGNKIYDRPCKICNNLFNLRTHRWEELVEQCICFKCDFWKKKVGLSQSIVVDGKHYTDGGRSMDPPSWKGFGGHRWKIRMFSDQLIETDNLWHQGTIPPWFVDKIPNNAEFI